MSTAGLARSVGWDGVGGRTRLGLSRKRLRVFLSQVVVTDST